MKTGMTTEKTVDVEEMVAECGSLAKAALAQVLLCIDEDGFRQFVYEEDGVEVGVEIENWTSGGVNMCPLVDLREAVAAGASATNVFAIKEEIQSLADDFDVDDEIDVWRNDAAYRAAFTYARASEDFSEWKSKLEALAEQIQSVVALYEQAGLCSEDFEDPDFTLQSVLDEIMESGV